MSFTFSPSKIKENFYKVQKDPYQALKFEYQVTKYLAYFIMALVAYNIIRIIVYYNSGSSFGSLYRLIIGVIGVVILYKIYTNVLVPKKKMLAYYENNPSSILDVKPIDPAKEVDDIINRFDKKGVKKQ